MIPQFAFNRLHLESSFLDKNVARAPQQSEFWAFSKVKCVKKYRFLCNSGCLV
jgi:hypothetical protein